MYTLAFITSLASFATAAPIIDSLVPNLLKVAPETLSIDSSAINIPSVIPKLTKLDINDLEATARTSSVLQLEPFFPQDILIEGNDTVVPRLVTLPDDRYQFTSRDFPYRTIGRLVHSNGVFCTAFAMGPRMVVAAKHCIPGQGVGATFTPNFDNGNAPYGSSAISTIVTNSYPRDSTSCDWQYDWAIYITVDRIGERTGWMGARTPVPARMGQNNLFSLGYPGDRDGGNRPYRHDRFRGLTQYESNAGMNCDSEPFVPLISDLDSAGGQSGSPIWELENGNPYVWGVHSVGPQEWRAHAAGSAFIQALINTRRDFP